MVGLPTNVGIKRMHRIGKWNPQQEKGDPARPILVQFTSTKWRDLLLAKAELVNTLTKGRYKIVPDNKPGNRELGTVSSNINTRNVLGKLPKALNE